MGFIYFTRLTSPLPSLIITLLLRTLDSHLGIGVVVHLLYSKPTMQRFAS